MRRLVIALVAAASACGGSRSGAHGESRVPGFQYAESTNRYRLTLTSHAVHRSGSDSTETSSSRVQRVSFELVRRSVDTLNLTVTMDSGVGTEDGKTLATSLTPAGRLLRVHATTEADRALAVQYVAYLPHVRVPLTDGAAWADTIHTRIVQNDLPITRRIIQSFRVEGDTAVDGNTAYRVVQKTWITFSGTGTRDGRGIALSGTGTGTAVHVISPNGVFLGASIRNVLQTTTALTSTGVSGTSTSVAAAFVERLPR